MLNFLGSIRRCAAGLLLKIVFKSLQKVQSAVNSLPYGTFFNVWLHHKISMNTCTVYLCRCEQDIKSLSSFDCILIEYKVS